LTTDPCPAGAHELGATAARRPARPLAWGGPRRRSLAWLRTRLRTSESWFIGLAVLVGAAAGLLAVLQAAIAHALQSRLYGFSLDERLSALPEIQPWTVLWLPAGGGLLAVIVWLTHRWRGRRLVDVVEANTLHGGVLSLRDSLAICGQTLVSNGFGGSVGLEAAYAQAGGAVASQVGQRARLRRNDLRTLVGAGAGAAIGAAFGAPLAGAFYAFEVVIGSYAPSMIAPVAAACLTSVLVARMVGSAPYSLEIAVTTSPDAAGYLLYAALGVVCAAAGIGLMRLVALAEGAVRRLRLRTPLRPVVGGVILAGLALISPQVLSSGHGALHADLVEHIGLQTLIVVVALKALASVTAIGTGFRGGLFFASLFLGSLIGQVYWNLIELSALAIQVPRENAALVGMGALASAVVGCPLAMSFLVLEATQSLGVAAATLAASLVASTIVRERFGYSLSTWRMHLRGESVRSARDIGWMRALTAGRLMRTDRPTIAASASTAEFRRRFPLGSARFAVLLDEAQRYAGVVTVATAHRDDVPPDAPIAELAGGRQATVSPDTAIDRLMAAFARHETDELVVNDPEGGVLGVVSEAYAARRYASELDRQQQGLFGER
jgi:CIC family chloride channel protein